MDESTVISEIQVSWRKIDRTSQHFSENMEEMTWPQTGLGRELREHAGYQTADTPEHMCAVKLWTFTSRENNITKGMK